MYFDIWNGVELTPSKMEKNALETASVKTKRDIPLNVAVMSVIISDTALRIIFLLI